MDYIVDGVQDGVIDDTLYVFDHYNQDLGFRAVEKLFLDDGWDTNEIWNLVTGEGSVRGGETYVGSAGQDVLIAGRAITTTLDGGDGQDIMIGDKYGKETIFIDKKYFRPTEVETLLGDPSKAATELGWTPKTTFTELVSEMIIEDLMLAKREELIKQQKY